MNKEITSDAAEGIGKLGSSLPDATQKGGSAIATCSQQLKLYLPVVLAAVVFLLCIFPYSTGYFDDRMTLLKHLMNKWASPDWQHGMFVPFVVAGLIYWRRKEISVIPIQGSKVGLVGCLFACFLYWIGYKAQEHYIGYAAVHLLLISSVLWFFGWRWLGALGFYLLFLTFMWPMHFLEDTIALKARYVMVAMSSGFLNAVGIENLKQGTAIVSAADVAKGLGVGESFRMDIDGPCSGMRSLFALMMVGALYGFVRFRTWGKQFTMFASALPLAIFGNFVRILLLVFGTLLFGSDFAIGKDGNDSAYHLGAGFAVFGVAIFGMLIFAEVIAKGVRGLIPKSNVRTVEAEDAA